MKVAERLRSQIASGLHLQTLHEGDRLPSIRELAREWQVDPRTVRAGYRSLEREGIVTLKARSGVYVAAADRGAASALPWQEEWVIDVLRRARERGIHPADLAEFVRQRTRTVRLRTACLECNEDQISWLVHETARDYGLDSFGVDLADTLSNGVPAELLKADLLVGTTFHATQLQALAETIGKPLVLVRLQPSFVREIVTCLARGPLYFVVADPRFAEKLPQIYARTRGCRMLTPVVAERNTRPDVPAGAAVLVTRAAQEKLGAAAIRSTIKRSGRLFCTESVAAILRAIVSANLTAVNRSGAATRRSA
ncbi:MAG: GntR family transcriptional regulator [Gemmatimonadaceae bacterium]